MSSVHPWNPPKGKFGVFPIRTEQRMLSWPWWLSSETEGPPSANTNIGIYSELAMCFREKIINFNVLDLSFHKLYVLLT